MPASSELFCIGLATLDTIVLLRRWPDPDGRQVVDRLQRAGGGPAATAAAAAARLGRSVAFIGAVGSDDTGARVREGLAASGVDVSKLAQREGPTAESVILVDPRAGTRSILHAAGVALGALEPAALSACQAAAWVHVDHAGWPLAAGLPRQRLSVDAGNPMADLDLADLGLYGPTRAALAERYPGLSISDAVAQALQEGAERVVVTLGADGALAADRHAAWRVPAPAVDVTSTLGAGDAFHGALLAALVEGLALPEAARMATVAAALSCRSLDGRSAIPDRAELEAALAGAPPAEPLGLVDG